jgi:hypothetical protein
MQVIQALKEAWILDNNTNNHRLSSGKRFPTTRQAVTETWLRNVEVRAVLDETEWTSLPTHFYDFLEGRRTWIVRDYVEQRGSLLQPTYPALLSSRGMEELAGWVNRVALARRGWRWWRSLDSSGLIILEPLLCALCSEDRIKVFQTAAGGQQITPRGVALLQSMRKKLPHSERF